MRVIPASDEAQQSRVSNLPIIRPLESATRPATSRRPHGWSRTSTLRERVQEDLDSRRLARKRCSEASRLSPSRNRTSWSSRAEAGTPEEAAELANSFAEQTIVEQTEELHDYIEPILPESRGSAREPRPGAEADALQATLTELQTLQNRPDPTLTILTEATPPSPPIESPARPQHRGRPLRRPVLGIAAAFALQVLDPRLRREEQLRRLYRLPILARIPKEVKKTDNPIDPLALSPAASEAYRTLRGTLAVQSATTATRLG